MLGVILNNTQIQSKVQYLQNNPQYMNAEKEKTYN